MPEVISIATRGAVHQKAWADLLASGLRIHGYEPRMVDAPGSAPSRIVACWGWKLGAFYRSKGHEVLVAERGYIGDRFHWTSLGWNGLNGRADFRLGDVDGERFERYHAGSMRPWKADGEYVLLLGQVMGDMSLAHVDYRGWLSRMAEELPVLGLPVVFRPHPQSRQEAFGMRIKGGGLEEALAGAAVAVAFNSNSATDAVMAGVPTIAMDEGAMAWPVSGHDIAMPPTPDRTEWANRLAWCQWSPGEIADGTAVAQIRLQSQGG